LSEGVNQGPIDKPKFLNDARLHFAFEIGLWIKAVFAVTEAAGGIATFFVTHQFVVRAAEIVTQGELAEDPHDLIANALLRMTQHFSVSTRHFTAAYLLGHGLIKLWLIAGLLRRRLWYYPTALGVFSLFIAYQLYRYHSTHSVWLLLVTAVDVVVVALTWWEFRYLRNGPP
jgi:uncharacterized membrane protein